MKATLKTLAILSLAISPAAISAQPQFYISASPAGWTLNAGLNAPTVYIVENAEPAVVYTPIYRPVIVRQHHRPAPYKELKNHYKTNKKSHKKNKQHHFVEKRQKQHGRHHR